MAPSVVHQAYAKSIGVSFLHSFKCDECSDYYAKAQRKTDALKQDKRVAGESVCNECGETDPSKFDEGSVTYCTNCKGKKKERHFTRKEDILLAVPEDKQYCRPCNSYKVPGFFVRKFRNLITGEIKSQPCSSCVPCLEERNKRGNGWVGIDDVHLEMREEKLSTLASNQKASNHYGCSKNCLHNLLALRKQLHGLLGKEEGDRVFVSNLEWDHRNTLTKTRCVSKIYNKEDRLKEIAKCDLLCIFCHRMKTYVHGDTIYRNDGTQHHKPITRQRLRAHLDMKRRRLDEQDTN